MAPMIRARENTEHEHQHCSNTSLDLGPTTSCVACAAAKNVTGDDVETKAPASAAFALSKSKATYVALSRKDSQHSGVVQRASLTVPSTYKATISKYTCLVAFFYFLPIDIFVLYST